jgi:hypothetical protein
MSDENQEDVAVAAAELDALKETATKLGVTFHPNIGTKTLSEKVTEKRKELEATPVAKDPGPPELFPTVEAAPIVEPTAEQIAEVVPFVPRAETAHEKVLRIRREQTALVRVRITCMNPNKTDWPGEIFSVGNKATGQIKKFVPYNEEFHVSRMALNMIQERNCQIFVKIRNPDGSKGVKGKLVKEFGVELLDALTQKELTELAQRQAMAAGTSA